MTDDKARIAELEAAILKAHPAGADEAADPMAVLRIMSNDIQREMMRGPESPIKFMDGDVEREIVWEDFEGYSGYVISENCEAFDDVQERAERAEAACAAFVKDYYSKAFRPAWLAKHVSRFEALADEMEDTSDG